MGAFEQAWSLIKGIGRCDFCLEDDVTVAPLPPHLTTEGQGGFNYMCDLCWLKMNDDRAKSGFDITPFPFPNKYQMFGDMEGME